MIKKSRKDCYANEGFLRRLDEKYEVIMCPAERESDLRDFIDRYWKRNHILARSPEFLRWNHFDADTGTYNFAIAIHRETGEIHAIEGVIPTSLFDRYISRPAVFGCVWKSREDVAEVGTGLYLGERIKSFMGIADPIGFGLSDTALGIVKKKRGETGTADQFYILNPRENDFKIADNTGTLTCSSEGRQAINPEKRFICLTESEFGAMTESGAAAVSAIPPHKSAAYYINRYFRHPVYTYFATGITGGAAAADGRFLGVFIWRFCRHDGAKCIRIVDYFGVMGALCGCVLEFERLLTEHNAEYIDFICVNMQPDELAAAGFLERHITPGVIIPNYFEPFVRANIEVRYNIPEGSSLTDGRIFKGDADQDRPS